MPKFLKWFFGLFSSYVHPFERRVNKFFRNIKSTDNIATIRKGLLKLMQENLIVVNIWMEKKYKGYKYLSKSVRAKMYKSAAAIVAKFGEFAGTENIDIQKIKTELEARGLDFPHGDEEKIQHIYKIMQFLKPGLYYHYIKTASFGKLLRNPSEEKLEGDCNQIVTLYIYLFSLKFDIGDLEIKLLPEHVCLHFRGIDVEATNGTFQKYKDDTQILPVTEIISTNLLDLADFREELQAISPRVMVKSAQLAYAISSLKTLVVKNLNIAYKNLAVGALKGNDFETAIFYFSKAGDMESLKSVYRNACIYFMDRNNFSKAGYFAGKSGDNELGSTVKRNEGIFYYKNNSIDKALAIFTSLGDEKMKKACYAKQYNKLAGAVSGVKTVTDAKKHRSTYQKMLELANRLEDSKLQKSVREVLSKM
ncbi:MAG: hypothetical protein ABIH78_01285 [Candidatus Peregrinibacteria bacterium]